MSFPPEVEVVFQPSEGPGTAHRRGDGRPGAAGPAVTMNDETRWKARWLRNGGAVVADAHGDPTSWPNPSVLGASRLVQVRVDEIQTKLAGVLSGEVGSWTWTRWKSAAFPPASRSEAEKLRAISQMFGVAVHGSRMAKVQGGAGW